MNNVADPGLLLEIRRYGRFDVNACLNCGSCTVVCDLSNGEVSFPRRPLRRALLGLRGPLSASLEPWLCHDCGDCSIACPQQTEPRESMMTLRRYLGAQYEFTGLGSKTFTSGAAEIIAFSLVGLLVFALVLVYHLYYKALPMSVSEFVAVPMGLEHMFPTIKYFTVIVFLIPALLLIVSVIRMWWFTMHGRDGLRISFRHYIAEAKMILFHMVSHQQIRKCVQQIHKVRWRKHWLLGLGLSIMFVIKFFFLDWYQTDAIYPIYHPQRWLGYLTAAILIYVPLDILIGRARKQEEMHKFSEVSDLMLPIVLSLAAVSGLAVHVFRYLEFSLTSHLAYAVHLAIAVPFLLVELPFGKSSHIIYRPLALYFQAVKERALTEAQPVMGKGPSEGLVTIGTPTV